jgi:peptidoglycan/LPS O-acetylase OafA/YrhL
MNGYASDPWSYRFFPTTLPYFLLGMIACRYRNAITHSAKLTGCLAGLTIAATLVVSPSRHVLEAIGLPADLAPLGYSVLLAVGIPSLFTLSNSPTIPKWLRALDARMGEFSYPMYVVHLPVVAAWTWQWPGLGASTNTTEKLAMIALIAGLSFLLVETVEKPIDRFRHARQNARKMAPVEKHSHAQSNTSAAEGRAAT